MMVAELTREERDLINDRQQDLLRLVGKDDPRVAFLAQASALATYISGVYELHGRDLEGAQDLLDSLHGVMVEHINEAWGRAREMPPLN